MKGRSSAPRGKQSPLELQAALRLLRRLEAGHTVSDSELLHALGTPEPPCPDPYDKGCRFRKDNPNCFCGFVPAPGSFRRKGLWQKEATLALGDDPAKGKREVCFLQPIVWCRKAGDLAAG